jgi:hypothetical protein
MDVHIKAAITAGRRRRGIDVATAQENEGTRLEETALLERATALQRVRCSHDDDLLAMAWARQATDVLFAGLIDGHQLAATVGTSGLDLDVVCQVVDPEDMAHRIESLLLRSVAHVPCLGEAWRGATRGATLRACLLEARCEARDGQTSRAEHGARRDRWG